MPMILLLGLGLAVAGCGTETGGAADATETQGTDTPASDDVWTAQDVAPNDGELIAVDSVDSVDSVEADRDAAVASETESAPETTLPTDVAVEDATDLWVDDDTSPDVVATSDTMPPLDALPPDVAADAISPPQDATADTALPPADVTVDVGPPADTVLPPADVAVDVGPPAPLVATFTVDEATLAPDPERGFFKWGGEVTSLTASELSSIFSSGARLTYVSVRLDAFRNSAIGQSELTKIATGLGRLRTAGLKGIVRVIYNSPENDTEFINAQDAPLERVLAHIVELGPVFAANADVIAFIQAGLIGAWGEWHQSSNGLTAEGPRTAIHDALLAHFPASRTVSFRNPPYLRAWHPTLPTVAARLAETGPGIGFHNDCFLASNSDVGTYPSTDRQALRDHMKALGRLYPFGGETCDPGDTAAARMTCADILAEGSDYGLTYLNRDYWTGFHDGWISGGCFDQVARSIGHRLSLTRLEMPPTASAGAAISVRVTAVNRGWARVHNRRPVVLHLSRAGLTHKVTIVGADIRAIGRGETVELVGTVQLPQGLSAGAWAVSIMLPDAAPSLADNPKYTTRLFNSANTGAGQRWVAADARFETGLSFIVE